MVETRQERTSSSRRLMDKETCVDTVAVLINGEVFTIHLVEETCYYPCRHKCLTGCSLGSFDDVIIGVV